MSTEPLSSVVSATAAVIALPNVLLKLVMFACSVATVLSSAAILAASFMVPGRDGRNARCVVSYGLHLLLSRSREMIHIR